MKVKLKLLKAWGGKQIGEIVEVSADEAKSLIETGYAEKVNEGDNSEAELTEMISKAVKKTVEEINKSQTNTKGGKTIPDVSGGDDALDKNPKSAFNNLGRFAKDLHNFQKPGSGNQPSVELRAILEGKAGKHIDTEGRAWGSNPNLKAVDTDGPLGANETIGADGGILLPVNIANEIYKATLSQEFNLEPLCAVTPMGTGNKMTFRRIVNEDRSSAAQIFGGIVCYWINEAKKITESKLQFSKQEISLKKLTALSYVTEEQMEDSDIALESILTEEVSQAITAMTSEGILFGNGLTELQGIATSGALATINPAATRTTAAPIALETILRMRSAFVARQPASVRWIMNQEMPPFLHQLTLGQNGIYLPGGLSGQSEADVMLGRKVVQTDYAKAPATAFDIALCDFSEYRIIKKGGIRTAMSIHLRFDFDETCFKFVYRIGGSTKLATTITPKNGSQKLSSFVNVQTTHV